MIRKYLALRTPHQECDSFLDIQWDDYKGYVLLIDVDNTIALRGSNEIDREIINKLRILRASGHIEDYCLVSNVVTRDLSRIDRVKGMAKQLNCGSVCAFYPNIKPKSLPYEEALQIMCAEASKAVMIGDQLMTDILGANKLGMKTVLVKPLGKDGWYTRPRRWMEKAIVLLRKLLKVSSPSH